MWFLTQTNDRLLSRCQSWRGDLAPNVHNLVLDLLRGGIDPSRDDISESPPSHGVCLGPRSTPTSPFLPEFFFSGLGLIARRFQTTPPLSPWNPSWPD